MWSAVSRRDIDGPSFHALRQTMFPRQKDIERLASLPKYVVPPRAVLCSPTICITSHRPGERRYIRASVVQHSLFPFSTLLTSLPQYLLQQRVLTLLTARRLRLGGTAGSLCTELRARTWWELRQEVREEGRQ